MIAWIRKLDTPRGLAAIAAFVCLAVLAATAPGMPIVWDEGEYLGRSDRIAEWFRLVAHVGAAGGGWHAFSSATIHDYWHFVTVDEGHPAWGGVPIAIATILFRGWLHPLTAARMGAMAVFSGACAGVAFRMRAAYGSIAAIVAVAALLTFPRLFAEAHFATLDGQLTAWWLLLWACEASGRTGAGAAVSSGVLGGLASATKFTGWLAWIPLVIARAASRDRRRVLELMIVIAVGGVTFYLVDPPMWRHPIASGVTHLQLNLHRTLNIPITFLGSTYDLHRPLPWYNTIAWLLMVTPVPLLLLGGIGAASAARRRDPVSVSLLLHWAVLMIVRAVPGPPPHDGIRLFLPAFGFWCVLAGAGAQRAWDTAGASAPARRLLLGGAMAAGLIGGAINVARYYPQTLSHYNLLVGGVRGAAALGMEPTYWWDSLDRKALTWLNEHTAPGERVAFSSTANISMIRGWGWLIPEQADRRAVFKWYVFQNRTSFLADSDRQLIRTAMPAYVGYAGDHVPSQVPADLAVPLLYVYSYDQYRTAIAEVSESR